MAESKVTRNCQIRVTLARNHLGVYRALHEVKDSKARRIYAAFDMRRQRISRYAYFTYRVADASNSSQGHIAPYEHVIFGTEKAAKMANTSIK